MSDLQTITDHARLDSVKRYAKTELARKRELMECKVIRLEERRGNSGVDFIEKNCNNLRWIWRKCMGIEPTRDGFSAPHRV